MIVRTIERLSGEPRIRIRLRPRFDYGARRPELTRGSNHVRYVGPTLTLRLTTDAPVSLVTDEISFVLEQPLTLLLGPDESLTERWTPWRASSGAERRATGASSCVTWPCPSSGRRP